MLTVFTNQAELFKELTKKLTAAYPDFSGDVELLKALQLSWEGKHKEAAAMLEAFTGEDRLNKKLAAVQILLVNVSSVLRLQIHIRFLNFKLSEVILLLSSVVLLSAWCIGTLKNYRRSWRRRHRSKTSLRLKMVFN